MFFTATKTTKEIDEHGRIYVLKVTLKCGKVVHKLGMCRSSRSVDRMMEIAYSFFKVYRYVPQIEMRRDKKVLVPLLVEQHMHRLLAEWSYRFDKKFGGSTEFFEDLDETVLLDYLDSFIYSMLLEGKTSMETDKYDSICKAIRGQDERSESLDLLQGSDELPF